MNMFQIQKFKNLYHVHTEHINSFDFYATPKEIKHNVGADFEIIKDMAFIRDEESKKLLINERCDGWKDILKILISLDSLPLPVLRDLYDMYKSKMKNVTIKNAYTVLSENETSKRLIFCLIPEILWANGDEHIKSRIFN